MSIQDVSNESFKSKYSATHSINNTGIVIIGLLYGESDFEKTITTTVMLGLDTDCNGATAGSIVGVLNCFERMNRYNEKWFDPLHNAVRSEIVDFNSEKITNIAERFFKVCKKVVKDV